MDVRGAAIRLALMGVLLVTLVAWLRHPNGRPNAILITVDTLRPDRLSAYGYQKHRTPNFDRLVHEGALFENVFCDVTWTTPSMASVMTGLYATRHGLRSSFRRLSPNAMTLAEVLRGNGYHTAAIVASYPVHSIFGLDQGFATYDQDFSKPMLLDDGEQHVAESGEDVRFSDNRQEMLDFLRARVRHDAYRSDEEVSDRAIAWLHRKRREPFFLWLHYFGPHEKPNKISDASQRLQAQLADYDPDVVSADREIGRVLTTLDDLGLTSRTLVVLHADHGQNLMEQNYFGHGRFLYDPTQWVPLIVRFPGHVPAGARVPRMVRNLDIFPTVLDLLGLASPGPGDGESLVRALDGTATVDERIYVETYLSANWLFADVIDEATDARLGFRRVGIRTPQWKFIANDPMPLLDQTDPPPVTDEIRKRYYSEELYDLEHDPAESRNVILEHKDLATQLLREVWLHQAAAPASSEHMTLDEATRERLKSLGYLAK